MYEVDNWWEAAVKEPHLVLCDDVGRWNWQRGLEGWETLKREGI